MSILFVILLLAAYFATSYITRRYRLYALKHSIVDVPSDRSSHDQPTPRGGGVSLVVVSLLCMTVLIFLPIDNISMLNLLPGAAIIAITGFLDDRYDLKYSIRFVAQLLTATLLITQLGGWSQFNVGTSVFDWGFWGTIIGILGIIWSINLFNFMDGIDAIASVEAIFVLLSGGLMIWLSGGEAVGIFCFILAASVAGFLSWNLSPAKIFMGDAGSYFLGFIIAALALIGENRYGVPVLIWVILYGAFWFDATVTLIRRLTKGENWRSAHKSHAYQRLHQYGWPHGKVAAAMAALNVILGIFAFAGYFLPQLLLPALVASTILLATVYLLIERARPMYAKV